jgi:hypothetical protein
MRSFIISLDLQFTGAFHAAPLVVYNYTETLMTTARQRFGKSIPEVTFSTTEGHPLPGNGSLTRFRSNE